MSEYDYIIMQTIERCWTDKDEDFITEEVKDWLDAENVDYCSDVIDLLIPQCLEEYKQEQKKLIPRLGV